MMSQKRSHATLLPSATGGGGSNNPPANMEDEGSKLCHSLSTSLYDLLTGAESHDANHDVNQQPTSSHGGDTDGDVYSRYLSSASATLASPSANSNSDDEDGEVDKATKWLHAAMSQVGVGPNSNVLNFWKRHGLTNGTTPNGSEDGATNFDDGRYLVFFVKQILMEGGNSTGVMNNGEQLLEDGGGERWLQTMESFHASILRLVRMGQQSGEQDVEGENGVGVVWQLLLQNANLTPELLGERLDAHLQECYQGVTRGSGGNEGKGGLMKYFAWPTFFRLASHANQYGGGNKRRRSNSSGPAKPRYFKSDYGGNKKDESKNEWLPLLGYAIGHAFLSNPFPPFSPNNNVVAEKLLYLQSSIIPTLPSMMAIGNFDYDTKNSLLGGILGCVLDLVGEWIVVDGLWLDELEGGGQGMAGNGGDEDTDDTGGYEKSRASVAQIVDILLTDG